MDIDHSDGMDIPAFLKRTEANTPKWRRPAEPRMSISPVVKAQLERTVRRDAKRAARTPVMAAVAAGQDTVGKIRKATDFPTDYVQAALRFLIKNRMVAKAGRRYYQF